jgi:endonuclease/exonuclease/phosphatase family metal-dependent hydrolase
MNPAQKRLRLFFLGLALSATGCTHFLYGNPIPPVRVLVFNMHAGKDAKNVDNLQRIADVVKETNADIVLLQEVDRFTTRSGKVDQVATLEKLTGYNSAFGKTLDYQGGDYGIAILSRWSILGDTLFHLPVVPPQARAGGSYEPRGALRISIAAPGGAIHVVNTHLDASRADSFRRQEIPQVLEIGKGMKKPGALVLVGGDLNSEPQSDVLGIVRSAGWVDLWTKCGSGNDLTYPQDKPVKRIDYLLTQPGVVCKKASVLTTDASDHRPVLFEIQR